MKLKLNVGEKYTLNIPMSVRTASSIGILPKGTEIEIQQKNEEYHQYLVENVWMHFSTVENAVL